jgi:hypothetical protein
MPDRHIGHWPQYFLGVSAALGEPLEESLEALGQVERRQAPELLAALRSSSREVRARGIARAVAAVVVGLDEMRLR